MLHPFNNSKGPSIYITNNARFRESDFQNLSNLADSGKASEIGSTGRFGCGWNSVYHFTDLPSILSGKHNTRMALLNFIKVMTWSYLTLTASTSPTPLSRPSPEFASSMHIYRPVDFLITLHRFAGTKLAQQFPDQFAPFMAYAFGSNMSVCDS